MKGREEERKKKVKESAFLIQINNDFLDRLSDKVDVWCFLFTYERGLKTCEKKLGVFFFFFFFYLFLFIITITFILIILIILIIIIILAYTPLLSHFQIWQSVKLRKKITLEKQITLIVYLFHSLHFNTDLSLKSIQTNKSLQQKLIFKILLTRLAQKNLINQLFFKKLDLIIFTL